MAGQWWDFSCDFDGTMLVHVRAKIIIQSIGKSPNLKEIIKQWFSASQCLQKTPRRRAQAAVFSVLALKSLVFRYYRDFDLCWRSASQPLLGPNKPKGSHSLRRNQKSCVASCACSQSNVSCVAGCGNQLGQPFLQAVASNSEGGPQKILQKRRKLAISQRGGKLAPNEMSPHRVQNKPEEYNPQNPLLHCNRILKHFGGRVGLLPNEGFRDCGQFSASWSMAQVSLPQ